MDTLQEGMISDIKNEITSRLKKRQEIKDKEARKNASKETKPATYVPKTELIKEREDFKKLFLKILNKYPKLKTNFDTSQSEVYRDQFEPIYNYSILYGYISTNNGISGEQSPEIMGLLDKFENEIKSVKLKYHSLDIDYKYYTYDFMLESNRNYTAKCLNPSVINESVSPREIIAWFRDIKKKTMVSANDIRKGRYESRNYFARWNTVIDGEFTMYQSMMSNIPNINIEMSMNDLLESIGMKLKGDIFRKYRGFIPLEEMRGIAIACTFKTNNLEYGKGMLFGKLFNFIVNTDRKDVPVSGSLTLEVAQKLINAKYLGAEVTSTINQDIFFKNAKRLPRRVLDNNKFITVFTHEMEIIVGNIDEIIAANAKDRYLEIFRDIFNQMTISVVEIVLQYNDAILLVMDNMDSIYAEHSTMTESVDISKCDIGTNIIRDNNTILENTRYLNNGGGDIMMTNAVINETAYTNVVNLLEEYCDNGLYENGGSMSVLIESLDGDEYSEFIPMLEEVNVLTDEKSEANVAARTGNIVKLKESLGKIKDYVLKLTPEREGKLLPDIIKVATMLILTSLGTKGVLSLTKGAGVAMASTVITHLVDVLARITVNVVNANDADRNIKACRDAILKVEEEIKDPAITSTRRNILGVYKVRLADAVAELEEAKTQYQLLHSGKTHADSASGVTPVHESVSQNHNIEGGIEMNNELKNTLLESIEATPEYKGGKVEETNASTANADAIGAPEKVASTSVVNDEPHIGSLFDDNGVDKAKVEDIQESATDSALFNTVVALVENATVMLENGITCTPLTESVDMNSYWKFAPILEAVDAIASPEVLSEAKEGKLGKLKAALQKAVNYFKGLDTKKATEFLPKLVKFLSSVINAVASGIKKGAGNLGSAVGAAVAPIYSVIDTFINKMATPFNVGPTILAVEATIATLNAKKSSCTDTKEQAVIEGQILKLESQLQKLNDKKGKKDAKVAKKAAKKEGTVQESAVEVNTAYATMQESISNYMIATSQADIGIIQESAVGDWFAKVKASITAYMNAVAKNNLMKKAARDKRKQLVAKHAVVVKAVKSIPLPEDFKCKIHEGSNDKIRMNLPTSDIAFQKFWKSYIMDYTKTSNEKTIRAQFDNTSVKDMVEKELGDMLKVFVKSGKEKCTRSEFEKILKQYHLGSVVVSGNPNIKNMISNVVKAPKYLESIEVNYLNRVTDVIKSMLTDLEAVAQKNPTRSGLQSLAAYIKQTSEAEMKAYEICYEVICTISEEGYSVLSKLSGAPIQEAVTMLESIEGTPDYEGGKVEETNDSSANVDAVGSTPAVASTSVVNDEDHIGSVFDNNGVQTKAENIQEAATDHVLFESVLALVNNNINMLQHGMTVRPLMESVDVDSYWKFVPILEAVDAIASPEVMAEAKQGKMGKLKAAIDKAIRYFYGLDPTSAGRFLPQLIKLLVILAISGVGSYVASGAVIGLTGGGAVLNTAAGLGTGAIVGTLVGTISNVIEKFITTKANSKNVGATISAVESAIASLNKKKETVETDKDKTALSGEIAKLTIALKQLNAIKAKQDSKADKKALTESVEGTPDYKGGKVEETNDSSANTDAIGAPEKVASTSVVNDEDHIGSIFDNNGAQTKVENIQESATSDVLFESVIALMNNNINMMEHGIGCKPLTESVDMNTYWELSPILEAVDAIASPEVLAEAKKGNLGKLKAALQKAVNYFYGLDEKSAGKFLPSLIKYLVYCLVTLSVGPAVGAKIGGAVVSASLRGGMGIGAGIATGIGAGVGGGTAIMILVGKIHEALDKFITTKANSKNVDATIASIKSAIVKLNEKKDAAEVGNKTKINDEIDRLELALKKLVAIKAKKEDKAEKKALNESAGFTGEEGIVNYWTF